MEGRLVQDWLTLNGAGDIQFVQTEALWLDISAYRDVMAWLHVEARTPPAGADVQVLYETAPLPDDRLFATVGGPVSLLADDTVTVTQMIGNQSALPPGRLFRWKIKLSTSAGGNWSVTFRIFVALNRPGYRTPSALAVAMSEASSIGTKKNTAVQTHGYGYGAFDSTTKIQVIKK